MSVSPDDFVHTTVEVQFLCTTDVGTPMILCSHDGQNELAVGIDLVCRLFEYDSEVESEDVMEADSLIPSLVSSLASPQQNESAELSFSDGPTGGTLARQARAGHLL